jgi:hypothetical protein
LGTQVALLAVAAVGCATGGSSAAPPTTESPPSWVVQTDVPAHAKASNGATADITFNGISWLLDSCGCAVVELTITGTSAQPFKYNDSFVTVGFGDGQQPWTHPEDAHRWGANPAANYTKINKLPPLRIGSVTAGQTAHGFAAFSVGSRHDLYVRVDDPDDVSDHEAGWQAPA